MIMFSNAGHSGTDAFPQLLDGLRSELGCQDVETLGDTILAAEEADFHWESRVAERHLGPSEWAGDDGEELDRVAIISFLKGHWHVAICLVDGDGSVHDLEQVRMMAGWATAFRMLAEAL